MDCEFIACAVQGSGLACVCRSGWKLVSPDSVFLEQPTDQPHPLVLIGLIDSGTLSSTMINTTSNPLGMFPLPPQAAQDEHRNDIEYRSRREDFSNTLSASNRFRSLILSLNFYENIFS